MVGQNFRFNGDTQTAKQVVDAGTIGEIYHAKTSWSRRAGIPRIGSWFTQKRFAGGGCTYDIGVHALDRCLFLMGEFDAAAVSGQTFAKFGPRGLGNGGWGRSEIDASAPFDVDDLSIALIKMKSGRTVLLETSWAAHGPLVDVNATQLFGTEGGLILPPVQVFKQSKGGYTTQFVDPLPPPVNTNRMYHFIECLLGKAKPFVKPAESVAVQKILDAIYTSAATGRESPNQMSKTPKKTPVALQLWSVKDEVKRDFAGAVSAVARDWLRRRGAGRLRQPRRQGRKGGPGRGRPQGRRDARRH
jgi:predicted dehydrogenase